MAFDDDVDKFVDVVEKEADRILRAVAVEISRRVILKTPVDTGRARGNWQLTKNTPAQDELTNDDRGGGSTISSNEKKAQQANRKDSIYVINNLPYIEFLEDGGSDQAPQGMVKTTVQEFRDIVKDKTRG